MNKAEELVQRICRGTFLSMWSIPNPEGKAKNKELCDVLIVCEPDIIVISVKEVLYRATEDYHTGATRWKTRAVDDSVRQIYGAERILGTLDSVQGANGIRLYLPSPERRRIHRVAVALGSAGEVPISDGDFGKGFVHVFDEVGLAVVMRELDTVTDFVDFLRATEVFLETTQVITEGLDSLLGYYLQNGRSYPKDADLLLLQDDIWGGFSSSDEFQTKKAADEESYFWDRLVEHIIASHDPALTESAGRQDDDNPPAERVVRVMARESRFNRRVLAKSFLEFRRDGSIRSRIMPSPSGVLYVFLLRPREHDRVARRKELLARMFIARGLRQEYKTVVGIATEAENPEIGFSVDAAMYHKEEWTAEDDVLLAQAQDATGAFVHPRWSRAREDEYPGVSAQEGMDGA